MCWKLGLQYGNTRSGGTFKSRAYQEVFRVTGLLPAEGMKVAHETLFSSQ
jgi:hypothetical protein